MAELEVTKVKPNVFVTIDHNACTGRMSRGQLWLYSEAVTAELTRILSSIGAGDAGAAEELLPLVYSELHRMATERMSREQPGQTLQVTALVHEAYLRLLGHGGIAQFDGRAHFFSAVAEAMRRILIERARRRNAQKRGGAARRLDLDPAMLMLDEVPPELLDLDDALTKLADESPEVARAVNLRFFAGLGIKECAATMEVSVATVNRHLAYARAWLFDALQEPDADLNEKP